MLLVLNTDVDINVDLMMTMEWISLLIGEAGGESGHMTMHICIIVSCQVFLFCQTFVCICVVHFFFFIASLKAAISMARIIFFFYVANVLKNTSG